MNKKFSRLFPQVNPAKAPTRCLREITRITRNYQRFSEDLFLSSPMIVWFSVTTSSWSRYIRLDSIPKLTKEHKKVRFRDCKNHNLSWNCWKPLRGRWSFRHVQLKILRLIKTFCCSTHLQISLAMENFFFVCKLLARFKPNWNLFRWCGIDMVCKLD